MAKVTKESLEGKIKGIEYRLRFGISLNEEYQLSAYKMLLYYMRAEEHEQQMREEYERGRL